MIGLGARIAVARVGRSLSQGELAALLGVTQTAVSYWEADKREPDLTMLLRLAEVLFVPVQLLLGEQFEHLGTEQAVAWWAGWRQGWVACANNVTAAAVLRPHLMPPRLAAPDAGPEWMSAVHEYQARGGGPQ